MHFRFLVFLFLFLDFRVAPAQFSFKKQNFPVTASGQSLDFPWAGGLNNPQFSSIDLDNDGKEDLFVFDRNGNKILTFLNRGAANNIDYALTNQYDNIFPYLQHWVLLVDFNCDGIKDIFTSLNFGISVYRGIKDGNGNLSFSLFSSQLQYFSGSSYIKLSVASVDIPAITDVDNDGDLDVLSFPSGGGLTVGYYRNQSVEKGYGCDSLVFELAEMCWGNFAQTTIDRSVEMGISCKGDRFESDEPARHHGTNAILAFDKDGDGDKELLFGDYNFNNLTLLTNGGTPSDANMVAQDTAFPSNSVPVLIDRLPAPFYVDIDNDGLNDLAAAPNSPNNSMNDNNVWLYKNTGSSTNAVFTFQSDSFLVSDMIDVGEGSNPVFFDYDGDSLQDLLIGNYQLKESPLSATSGITLYRNTGTQQSPAFEWVTNDFANLNAIADLKGIMPAFGDLDGDGDKDMIIGDAYGSDDGMLHYFENTAGAGNPANFVLTQPQLQGIDVGQFSTPQLVDANRDGKLDLVIGERNGNLNYYENTGTANSPAFTLVSNTFGGVDVKKSGYVTGYSVPFLTTLDATDNYYLLAGTESGYIFLYGNIDSNLTGNFTLIDSVFQNINEGLRSSVSGGDMDGDGRTDLLIGNNRGGVQIYKPDSASSISEVAFEKMQVVVYPNPLTHSANLRVTNWYEFTNEELELRIFDVLGREVLQLNNLITNHSIAISRNSLPDGIYFYRVTIDKKTAARGKLVIQ